MVLNLPLDECIDYTHIWESERNGKRKETNKKKLQQAIESQKRQRARSLEEDKSQTP
jgi:hypothetical protein